MHTSIKITISILSICFASTSFACDKHKNKNTSTEKVSITNIPTTADTPITSTEKKTPITVDHKQAILNEAKKPLPLNPDVRFGKLENGLTYYIQKNTKPENRVELRLAVNAGSNQEEETQKGLAHFVEHMAFNGSKHFSKNELVNYLESIGTKFGAHLNAYTSFDETVYMLQLPTDKKEILDKGLLVLEDWAGGLTFDTTEINKERGVVYSEWRSRLGAEKRMLDKFLPILYYKSHYAERLPIGDTAVILRAPYERLISFYKRWYRPDLMSVSIVGDINVDSMEMEIKTRFKKLKNPDKEVKKEIYDLPKHKETLVSICTDPEATYSRAIITYKHPTTDGNSMLGYRMYLANALFNSMLNARLQEKTQQPDPPYFAAYSSYDKETRANDAYTLTAIAKSGKTIDALKVILTENERVRRYGFTNSELDRAKLDLLTGYDNALKEKNKTESNHIVTEYVSNFLDNIPAPGIDLEVIMAQFLIPSIKLEEINNLPKQYISDSNCVIVLTAPESEKKFLPWENKIIEIANQIKLDTISAYTDHITNEPLMESLKTKSPIISETINEKYNITTLQLKNGVRILLKPTSFKNDEILMSAYSNGGTSLYSDDDFMSVDYSNAIVAESGVSKFDKITLQKMLVGKTANALPYIGELDEGFNGGSNQKDVETMLQLTYLYFTQPRKSLDDFNTFMVKQKGITEHSLENPNNYFNNKLQNIIFNNNIRRGITTTEKLNKIDFEKAYKFYHERFSNASDFTFIFVGNLDIEKLKPLLETYLGSLPSNDQKETWKDPNITKKDGIVTSKIQMGKTQKDLVAIHFHGQQKWTEEDSYLFSSMIKILNIQLREALREDKGGVYGVGVGGSFAQRPKNAYGINIQFNTEPSRVDELLKTVYSNIDTLKTNGPSDDKIKKVQETQRRERETDLKENDFWLNSIQYFDQYGKDIAQLEKYNQLIDGLTAQKIKEAFTKYFDINNHIELVLEPEK
jgi:zinc protease